jgi:peptidoglycan hydrolase-like protein with peptidoglycan-binding domain
MPLKLPRQLPRAVRPLSTARGVAGLGALAASAGMLMTAPVAAAQPPELTGLLSLGAKGSTVKDVQHALHIKKTGDYTKSTKKSVVRYQEKKGLEIDGVVGPQTWDSLFHITSYASDGYSIPSSIVQCESDGDWGAVNSSSGAGGAYQILPSTWAAYGGSGSPEDASPAEQSAIAARIYATQGPSAWTC